MGELRNGLIGDGDDGTGTSVTGASLDHQSLIKQDLDADKAGMSNWNGLYSQIVRINLGIQEISSSTVVADNLKRSEEHTSELQSRQYLVCRLLLEKKN